MTAPADLLRHYAWCTSPAVRKSAVMLSRHQTRYRCADCGAECYVIGDPNPTKEQSK